MRYFDIGIVAIDAHHGLRGTEEAEEAQMKPFPSAIHRAPLFASVLLAAALSVAEAQTLQPHSNPQTSPSAPSGITTCPDAASRDLSHSCGVISPPATGDTGVVQVPNQGSMPVIPPPGTPGGDSSVQPK